MTAMHDYQKDPEIIKTLQNYLFHLLYMLQMFLYIRLAFRYTLSSVVSMQILMTLLYNMLMI